MAQTSRLCITRTIRVSIRISLHNPLLDPVPILVRPVEFKLL